MSSRRKALPLLILLLAASALLSLLGPPERVLGASARIVYLHGAWVWAALLALAAAALVGAYALVVRRASAHRWSVGLGRSGTLFWITSLALSLWAMQANWNGLFLAEPRWRLGVQFGVAAILIHVAATVIRHAALGSILNLGLFAALAVSLGAVDSVLHPASPIASSESGAIRLHFLALLGLTGLAAFQLARLLRPGR